MSTVNALGLATALDEDGMTTGVNSVAVPDQPSDASTGSVYIFVKNGDSWSQQAYVKASNTGRNDWFGSRLNLSSDGDTLAVGSQLEDSAAQGINAEQDDDSAGDAGAVYLFTRDGNTWSQLAYVKGSNTEAFDEFGSSMSLSSDGRTMARLQSSCFASAAARCCSASFDSTGGARGEDSAATGIDGDQSDNTAYDSGAVYLFSR